MKAITHKRITIAMASFATATLLFGKVPKPDSEQAEAKPPTVEAVFVLDTTGSMGGMIAGAKEKIWSIANSLATAKPVPVIKIGLIAYRDRGDDYITKITPMTSDLDAVYSRLMEFQAGGGGDGPESVNQGVSEAISEMGWSKEMDTYKVIFLVGDCPPHMDYQDDIKYPQSCEAATGRGIVINTILCGTDTEAMQIWKDIALKAEGEFFQVAQEGSAIMIDTPMDKELAELSVKLDSTRIFYGSKIELEASQKRAAIAGKLTDSSSVSAQAQRAVFNSSKAGSANFLRGRELINEYITNKEVLNDLASDELPSELAKMDKQQLREHVETLDRTRKAIQGQIRGLSEKRQSFIQKEMAKVKGKKEKSLEYNVYRTIKEQTSDKDVTYEAADAVY